VLPYPCCKSTLKAVSLQQTVCRTIAFLCRDSRMIKVRRVDAASEAAADSLGRLGLAQHTPPNSRSQVTRAGTLEPSEVV